MEANDWGLPHDYEVASRFDTFEFDEVLEDSSNSNIDHEYFYCCSYPTPASCGYSVPCVLVRPPDTIYPDQFDMSVLDQMLHKNVACDDLDCDDLDDLPSL